MPEEEAIKILIEALKYYRDGFHSSAYSTMGFTALAAGWLITSQSARDFIHSHRWLGWSAIAMIMASFAGYWKMAIGVMKLSLEVSGKLHTYGNAAGLYEHYLLKQSGVNGYILIQGLATAFIILVLIAILFPPREEQEVTPTPKKKSAKSK